MNPTSMKIRGDRQNKDNRPAAGRDSPGLGRLRVVLVSATTGASVALTEVAPLFLWFTGHSGNANLPVIGQAP